MQDLILFLDVLSGYLQQMLQKRHLNEFLSYLQHPHQKYLFGLESLHKAWVIDNLNEFVVVDELSPEPLEE